MFVLASKLKNSFLSFSANLEPLAEKDEFLLTQFKLPLLRRGLSRNTTLASFSGS